MSKRSNKNRYREAVALVESKPEQRRNSPIQYILEQQKIRARQDLLKLRIAIDCAENIGTYNRQFLHDIYREIDKDPTLTSNWESRRMKVKERAFKVCNDSGKENKSLTKVLESQWFFDWIDACLDSRKWGYSLIEFGPLYNGEFLPYQVGDKFYDPITVLDRDNVKPEIGRITQTPGDNQGISFSDPKYADYLMFVGNFQNNKGLLFDLAKYILFKDNCLSNWSEWAEIFGMDKRVGYTEATGEDRTRFIRAVRDIGSSSYAVLSNSHQEKIEYIGSTRQDAYRVYHELIKYIDEQIAKRVFGQDVISNNTGQVVGKVGENVANMYGASDAKFIEALVNKRLFPLMERLGFSWQGHSFQWDTTEKLSLKERAEIDLKVSQMGKVHSDEYINNTYGTQVSSKSTEDSADISKVNEKLRSMYEYEANHDRSGKRY